MSAPSDPLDVLKPLISAVTKKLRPLLGLLMVHTVFGAMLVPLLLALIYFSNARIRRKPLFWVILFDICIGLAIAIWDDYAMLSVLFNPQNGVPVDTFIAFPIVQSLSTWVVDLTLLMRLIAVYPYSSTPTSKFIAIFAFPAIIKIARIALIVSSEVLYAKLVHSVNSFAVQDVSTEGLSTYPTIVAQFFCELSDHLYVSTIFLYKLYGGFARSAKSGRVTSGGLDSFARRIRSLFYIAFGNFVFPVLFNIVLIITFYSKNASNVIYIIPSNTFVTIFGVVFATIWNHASHHDAEAPSTPQYVKTTGASSNAKPFSALDFKHDDSMNTRNDTGNSIGTVVVGAPGSTISSRGNEGSAGTLALDGLHFSEVGKTNNNDSFLDITMHEPEESLGRDTAMVMHRV